MIDSSRLTRAFVLAGTAWFATVTFASEPEPPPAPLIEEVDQYVRSLPNDSSQLDSERLPVLNRFADQIVQTVDQQGKASLVFICTHNSRRSHLSHVWAQTAAWYFGIGQVQTYSGGTEVTACNPRTVAALQRAGLDVQKLSDGSNPRYRVRYGVTAPALQVFSKVYSDASAGNPEQGFIAGMCCSQVDEECPVIDGAIARIPLHYDDPKSADDTPEESATYDERCRQIAAEMFYVMRRVSEAI